jgi:hypothetical protein
LLMRTAFFLAPIILLAVVLRLPAFFQPAWYGDEGIFAAVAQAMSNGAFLYSDIWDNKPPGIFLVYLSAYLTGIDMLVVRLLDLGAMLGVVTLVFLMARRVAGELPAAIAGGVCAVLLASPIFEGHLANTETFMVLFTSLGMYLLLRRLDTPAVRPELLFAPGLAFGAALMFKQVAVFDAMAALLFVLLFFRLEPRYIGGFVAGLAVPPLLAGGLFFVTGSFADFWYATVVHLVDYRGDAPATGQLAIKLLPLAIALPYVVWLRPWKTGLSEGLLQLWLAFAVLGVVASGRAYPHYLIQAVPPLALVLVAWAVGRHLVMLRRGNVTAGLLVACLALYHVVFSPLGWVAWNQEPQTTREYYRNFLEYASGERSREQYEAFFDWRVPAHLRLIEEVKELSLDSSTLFVWGDLPWIYPEAGLENPTRYPVLFNAHAVEGSNEAVANLLIEAQSPYVLVLDGAAGDWEEVDDLLSEYYTYVLSLEGAVLYGLVTEDGGDEPVASQSRATGGLAFRTLILASASDAFAVGRSAWSSRERALWRDTLAGRGLSEGW